MKLLDYINKNHNGNKAAFGREFGMEPQDVTKLFRAKGAYKIYGDELVRVCKKKVKKSKKNNLRYS